MEYRREEVGTRSGGSLTGFSSILMVVHGRVSPFIVVIVQNVLVEFEPGAELHRAESARKQGVERRTAMIHVQIVMDVLQVFD